MITSTSTTKSKQYAHRINKVLGYIRNNVGAPLRLETLARVACLSPYHFHRIFHAVMGERLHLENLGSATRGSRCTMSALNSDHFSGTSLLPATAMMHPLRGRMASSTLAATMSPACTA